MMHLLTGSERLAALIRNPSIALGGDVLFLRDVVARHPYFSLGHYALGAISAAVSDNRGHASVSDCSAALGARLAVKPYPTLMVGDCSGLCSEVFAAPCSESGYVADSVFNFGADFVLGSISDSAFEEQEDISVDSIAENDEIISETLAQIYVSQGQINKAIDIYYKLSLKYPEKSVYFADLINMYSSNY